MLLWEVMSLGHIPYPGRGNLEVMQFVGHGGRLESPSQCPELVYAIMTSCWNSVPDERPCFETILERLSYCIQVTVALYLCIRVVFLKDNKLTDPANSRLFRDAFIISGQNKFYLTHLEVSNSFGKILKFKENLFT